MVTESSGQLNSLTLLLFLLGLLPADSIKVKMNGKIHTVYQNANVTIPCRVYDYGSLPLDIRGVGVRWFRRRPNSTNEEKIFEFRGGQQISFRSGANLSLSGLRQGDASLFLPSFQYQDGGEYTCEMIITPERAQGTTKVDVIDTCILEHKKDNCIMPTIVIVLSSLAFLILLLVVWHFWSSHYKKVKPALALFLRTQYLVHKEQKDLYFVIFGFQPKSLLLKVSIVKNPKRRESKEEPLICWRTLDNKDDQDSESRSLLTMEEDPFIHLVPQAQGLDLFSVFCKYSVVPDLTVFTEADFLFQVEHSSLKVPLRKKISLQVIAEPKLKRIQCSSDHLQAGKSVNLICRIHSFFPRDIKVSWHKEGRLMLEGIETSEAVEIPEDAPLYSCTSKLEFFLQMEDLGKRFTCRAEVEGGKSVEQHWVLEAKCETSLL